MKDYKLVITTQELLGMLSKHLTSTLNKPIEVKERHRMNERSIQVEIYFEEETEILGHKATKTGTLTEEDIISILDELTDNYTVESLTFNTEIALEGYYECEVPKFNGVTLHLKEKQNRLGK